jgi:hypothetical protein
MRGGTAVRYINEPFLVRFISSLDSVSWDEFARTWNRPVHLFLLRHVYHSSISAIKVNKKQATIITFFLSACVHELVIYCLFKKLRGYLLVLQMCQLPVRVLIMSRGPQSSSNTLCDCMHTDESYVTVSSTQSHKVFKRP